MDALVRWFEGQSFPEAPFSIGPALQVVDLERFLEEFRDHIDRCDRNRGEIPILRQRMRRLKAHFEKENPA